MIFNRVTFQFILLSTFCNVIVETYINIHTYVSTYVADKENTIARGHYKKKVLICSCLRIYLEHVKKYLFVSFKQRKLGPFSVLLQIIIRYYYSYERFNSVKFRRPYYGHDQSRIHPRFARVPFSFAILLFDDCLQ